MNPANCPSLLPQIKLANALFGLRGGKLLNNWFDLQYSRISDPVFARLFSDHITLKGINTTDYNHRHIKFGGRNLLAGIRFFDQDPAQPYVEVIAHNFNDWAMLRTCVASEWRDFKPSRMRLLVAPDAAAPDDATIDMTIHAARYEDMATANKKVALKNFDNPAQIINLVMDKYNSLTKTDPQLSHNVSAAHPDDLHTWYAADQIKAIRTTVKDIPATVGLLAIAPGSVEWIEGDEIKEEVVVSPYNGENFAASAQCTWARKKNIDPKQLLIGTIDRLNIASRRTAIKSGRNIILNYIFCPTDSADLA